MDPLNVLSVKRAEEREGGYYSDQSMHSRLLKGVQRSGRAGTCDQSMHSRLLTSSVLNYCWSGTSNTMDVYEIKLYMVTLH